LREQETRIHTHTAPLPAASSSHARHPSSTKGAPPPAVVPRRTGRARVARCPVRSGELASCQPVPCMCTHQIVTRHLRLHLRACALHLHRRPRIHCATSHASRMHFAWPSLDRISDANLGMPSHAAVPVHPGAGPLSLRRPFIISMGEIDISVGEIDISVVRSRAPWGRSRAPIN
jgi:hypothetical protein